MRPVPIRWSVGVYVCKAWKVGYFLVDLGVVLHGTRAKRVEADIYRVQLR